MSLYANYIQEREGKSIVEDDKGFATYGFVNGSCYIESIYVLPEHRKSGVAARYADQIAVIAKERGINSLLGSVAPTANGSTDSLKALLAYGFKLDSASNNFIVLKKEI